MPPARMRLALKDAGSSFLNAVRLVVEKEVVNMALALVTATVAAFNAAAAADVAVGLNNGGTLLEGCGC